MLFQTTLRRLQQSFNTKTATECGYLSIQWDIDSLDWKDYGVQSIIDRTALNPELSNGSIILMHNGAKYTKDALETVISTLQSKGYEFVTLSELVYKDHFHMDPSGKQILILTSFSTFFNNYAILKTKFKCFRKGDFMEYTNEIKRKH